MALSFTFAAPVSSTGTNVGAGVAPLTITDAPNQTLFVGLVFDDQGTSTRAVEVKYNGSTLTQIDQSTVSGPHFGVWYMVNPPAGSAFDITSSGAPAFNNRQFNIQAVIVNDNDQGTPNDAPNRFNTAASSNTSLTTGSAAGDAVLSFVCVDNKTSGTVQPTAGSSTHSETSGAGSVYIGASVSDGAASVNTGWNWTGNTIATEIAFNVNVAAAIAAAVRNRARLTMGVGS